MIVDEAQSLERNVLLTDPPAASARTPAWCSRTTWASAKTFASVGTDGVASVIETLKGHGLFGHVTLTRSERSAIAALVTELLEAGELS